MQFCKKLLGVKQSTQNDFVYGEFLFLFYPITLEGRRGTTDEFATIPFHLDLFSAALVELAKSIPVHSLILSSHLFFCLPLFLFPFTGELGRINFASYRYVSIVRFWLTLVTLNENKYSKCVYKMMLNDCQVNPQKSN